MAGNIVIRTVGEDERAAWEPLWNGYLAFYKATLAPGASDVAWQRFHDPDEPMFLLGAYADGKLIGIVAVSVSPVELDAGQLLLPAGSVRLGRRAAV